MTVEEQLEQANAQIATLTTANTTLQTDLDATRTSATTAIRERDALSAQVSPLTTDRDSQRARADKAETDLTASLAEATTQRTRADKADSDFAAYKADERKRFNGELQRTVSAQGVPFAVQQWANSHTSGPEKPDFSKLTGLEKATAAHEYAQKHAGK